MEKLELSHTYAAATVNLFLCDALSLCYSVVTR